jgi:antitoxin MazE
MDATVQKWGNSLALRIPKSVAKDLGLSQGSAVELAVVDGEVVLKPKKARKASLSGLLREVTPENLHGEADWGGSTGQEAW